MAAKKAKKGMGFKAAAAAVAKKPGVSQQDANALPSKRQRGAVASKRQRGGY
jgi:hypothetical protein